MGALRVAENRPAQHYDIGSRIDGFISHLLVLKINEIFIIDIRPLTTNIKGVNFKQADATNLDGIADESIDSLSALCSFEHFGLGRYGDPVDSEACFKAFKAAQRVMKSGGRIYISVPVAVKDYCQFNAARIFRPQTIVNEFNDCILEEFSYIDRESEEVLKEKVAIDCLCDNDRYFTGLFIFKKK